MHRVQLYPYVVDRFGNPPPIRRIRRALIPRAVGVVLEIGAGSGANFPFYDPQRVGKLYALEPNHGMRRLAARRLPPALDTEFIDLPGERIPLPDDSVDTVVSTFTLCTIDGIQEAILGLRRVLRQQGQFLFFELGLSPDATVQRWQRILEPAGRWLFQGLRLTRDIPALIEKGGFRMDQLESGYIAPSPRSLTYCWWGIATRDVR